MVDLTQTLARQHHLARTRSVIIETACEYTSEQLPKAYKQLVTRAKKELEIVYAMLEEGRPLQITSQDDFRYSYAHGDCALLVRGFLNLGLDVKLLLERDETVHWVGVLSSNGRPYYIDSYGVFPSLMPISARYIHNQIDSSVTYDEERHSETLANQTIEFWDELEGAIVKANNLDEEDSHQDVVSDYEDYASVLIVHTCLSLLIDDNL